MSVLVPTPEPAAPAGRATSAVTSPRPATAPPTTSTAPTSTQGRRPTSMPIPRPAPPPVAGRVSSVPTGLGAWIEARHDTTGGVIITAGGDLGRNAVAVLSRQLHSALESAPGVVVVNVRAVTGADPCAQEVLAVVRDRTRAANIGLHVVDPHHHLTDDH